MILWVFIKNFGVKIVITDIYRYFFRNFRTSARAPQSRFFSGKIGIFRFFGEKSVILPIFPLIDFSSALSSRCRPKTDFSAIYRPKKPIFLSNGDGDEKSKILLKSDPLPSLLHTFQGRTFLLCTSGPFHGQSPEKKSLKQLNRYILRNHSNS